MEKTVKIWVCDWCKKETRRGVMPPGAWSTASDFCGNEAHACYDPECVEKLKKFAADNGLTALIAPNQADARGTG